MSKSIIRIEHPSNGIGIFANEYDICVKRDKFSRLIDRHQKFPTPSEDIFKNPKYNFDFKDFCAFKSVSQIRRWITNIEMKEIIKLGYKVLMLEVSECNEGKFQITYDKANIINTTDITDIFYKDENNVENI